MASPTKSGVKRPRLTSPNSPPPNPHSHDVDLLLESVIAVSDSSAVDLNLSFDRILDSISCHSDKVDTIERALRFGTLFLDAAKLSARKMAAMHNTAVWYLPYDLTVKIFSMIDTQSLCYAATACSFFRRCAEDPTCYTDIECMNPNVNDAVVSTMIQRAGKSLRSLKLGPLPQPTTFPGLLNLKAADTNGVPGPGMLTFSKSCLTSLCASGSSLKRLHLYNIRRMSYSALDGALSACPSLTDLGIVGLVMVSHYGVQNYMVARRVLESVSAYCRLMEHFFFESSITGRDDSIKLSTCSDLIRNCPNMSSLALRGFRLHDFHAREFLKGFQKLKHVDFSACLMTGVFLRGLGRTVGGSQLEVLLLRGCFNLKHEQVTRFLSSILAGDFKHLKHLDISSEMGLVYEGEGDAPRRCFTPSLHPLDQLREVRPELCIVAEYPVDGSGTTETASYEETSDEGETLSSDLMPTGSSSDGVLSPISSQSSSDIGGSSSS